MLLETKINRRDAEKGFVTQLFARCWLARISNGATRTNTSSLLFLLLQPLRRQPTLGKASPSHQC